MKLFGKEPPPGLQHLAGKQIPERGSLDYLRQASSLSHPVIGLRFPGFSLTVLPSEATAEAFLEEMDIIAHAPGKPGMWEQITGELRDKGFAHEADLLKRHLSEHGQAPFYRAMDNWLEALSQRSPETALHIRRQSVAMALTTRAMFSDLPDTARDSETVRALIAATAHNVGKLALDPVLLHKPYRVEPEKLETLLTTYQDQVPDYREKAGHIQFLRMLNGGRVPLDTTPATDTFSLQDILKRLSEKPQLGEPDFASVALKGSCRRVYEHIKAKTVESGLLFDAELERALLNDGRRGTVSAQEARVIAVHDALGRKIVERIGLPEELNLHPAIVDLGIAGTVELTRDKRQDLLPIRALIHLTDIMEAVTGQREYNRANGMNKTPDEANQILRQAAKFDHLSKRMVGDFERKHVAADYAALYPDIPKDRRPENSIAARGASFDKTITHTVPGRQPGG